MFHHTQVLCVVVGLIASGATEMARADHRSGFRIGIGIGDPGGGFGLGYSRGGGGFFYGSRPYYGPSPYYYDYGPRPYVTPQYYYAPQPTYVVPDSTYYVPDPRFDGGEIKLFNPKGAPGAVKYALNGHVFVMRPGEQQKIPYDRPWRIILLDERGEVPTGEYSLSKGQFKFKMTERGWDLVEVDDSIVAPRPADPRPAPPTPIEPTPAGPTPPPKPTQPKLIDISPPDKTPVENKPTAPSLGNPPSATP